MPLIVFWLLILFQLQASAQSSIELTCRSQAKEVAVQTYQNCVTEARNQKVEDIRKEYQAKLSELKSHYDSELKSMSAPMTAAGATKAAKNETGTNKTLKTSGKKLKSVAVEKQNSESKRKLAPSDRLPEKQQLTKTLPAYQAVPDSTQTVTTSDTPAPQMIDVENEQKSESSETSNDELAQ